jgi:hypothetical protein
LWISCFTSRIISNFTDAEKAAVSKESNHCPTNALKKRFNAKRGCPFLYKKAIPQQSCNVSHRRQKINVKQKRLKLCLAVKKEKDTRSLLTKGKKDSEKIDIRRSRFLLV